MSLAGADRLRSAIAQRLAPAKVARDRRHAGSILSRMSRLFASGVAAVACLLGLVQAASAQTSSFYTTRLDDPKAVYLASDAFGVKGDGSGDDTAALQAAIDKVQETSGEGIVFVPSGRYRLTNTVYVWGGIRLIGYGATRPVLVLGPNTPGYGDPTQEKYLVFFSGNRPGTGRGGRGDGGRGGPPPQAAVGRGAGTPRDAGAGTFYSAMSNIDVEIGNGNPGAVGVRGRYAQHSFIAHSDFRIGSGLAGVHDTGNVMEDVHFHGGDYGIWTQRPSPGWQFTAVDATFDGQRVAAIRERAAGLTLIRPHFADVPAAVAVEPTFHDEIWIRDGRFENISGPAVVISNEKNAQTQINMENVVCDRVATFAKYQDSGRTVSGPAARYVVRTFSYGVSYADVGAAPATKQVFDAAPLAMLPPPVASDLAELPARDSWVNIRTLGAKGDGATDDTEVFRKAIAEHRAIYLPSGYYVVTDTLTLRPDTVLIGLHPDRTQIVVPDRTPAFQGVGGPKPLIEAPKGGSNILTGIGLYTNGINPRAVAAKWMAGSSSMLNDVRFLGGHGTSHIDGTRENPYNNTHTADPDLNRRWDGQYPSLWVTDGGGGTFFDIWTPSTFAQAGMLVSNTSTEGRVYEMSSEHHVRHEIQLHHVSNWRIYALQTEEERGEGGFALPLEIVDSSHITIANFFIYRVISMFQPFRDAIEIAGSKDIRFRNVHSYSNSKVSFDTTVYDRTHRVEIRQREFASLTVSGAAPVAAAKPASVITQAGARLQRLAGGFYNISGGAVSPSGDYYFVDNHWQRIYRWNVATHQLSTVRDNALDPANLAFDKAGNLLVTSFAGNGTVYSFKPDATDDEITVVKPSPLEARPNAAAWLPVGDWRVNRQALTKPAAQFVSPDGSTFLPAGEDFLNGAVSFGIKSSGQLRGFGLAPAKPGQRAYITDESDQTTWSGVVQPDGALADLGVFAYRGGEGVAVDASGNVYLAAGQIYVYDPKGKQVDAIDVPERPIQMSFGGRDGRTLFIAARTSLYAVRMRNRGR
jgi:sugar lactone lactonase YvrE